MKQSISLIRASYSCVAREQTWRFNSFTHIFFLDWRIWMSMKHANPWQTPKFKRAFISCHKKSKLSKQFQNTFRNFDYIRSLCHQLNKISYFSNSRTSKSEFMANKKSPIYNFRIKCRHDKLIFNFPNPKYIHYFSK